MSNYREQFVAAIARTTAHKMNVVDVVLQREVTPIPTEYGAGVAEIYERLVQGYLRLNPAEAVRKCLPISLAVQQELVVLLKTPLILTIGTVEVASGEQVWPISEPYFENMASSGSFHAWLTTPSLEIVDFMFHAAYRYPRGGSAHGAVPIIAFPDTLSRNRWCPIFVGQEAGLTLLARLAGL